MIDRLWTKRRTLMKIALTGMKPTGSPHLGNYIGMIQPALELAQSFRALYFVADYHALTVTPDPEALNRQSREIAATWLALGLDPAKAILFRQSDIPELFEFEWILACFTPKGILNRAHAYKAAVEKNTNENRYPDDGINAGLYSYPVLMAADILLFGAEVVPVGADQKQHIEMARDIATVINNRHADILTVPEPLIRDNHINFPGIDGRKMSKSYRNTIPIFASQQAIRKQVMQIKTDSKRPDDPKNPEECHVFGMFRHFAPPEAVTAWRERYINGGAAYSQIKAELADLLEAKFGKSRQRYEALLRDPEQINGVLTKGATTARSIANPILKKLRSCIGIDIAPSRLSSL